MTKSRKSGAISIEASLVFIVFVISYFIVNSVAYSIMFESYTRKSLYETGQELNLIMQIVDSANYSKDLATESFDSSIYKDLISEELSDVQINLSNVFNKISSQAKEDSYNSIKKNITKDFVKRMFLAKLDKINHNLYKSNLLKEKDFEISKLKIFEDGNNIEIALTYTYKLDKFSMFSFENKVEQNYLLASPVENLYHSNTLNNNIWQKTNFERGRYFAKLLRDNSNNPIEIGNGLDFYDEESDSLVEVYSLNIFKSTYSQETSGKYLLKEEFIKQLSIYHNKMLENISKYKGEYKGKNSKLLIVLPEEALDKTNLSSYMNEIKKIGNIEFIYMERALDVSNNNI